MEVFDIYIDGAQNVRGSMKVFFNEKECIIQNAVFKILLKLCTESPEWVSKYDFGEGEIGAKYIARLRQQVKKIGLDLVIENGQRVGHMRYYRIKVDRISINSKALSKHWDFGVREMVGA